MQAKVRHAANIVTRRHSLAKQADEEVDTNLEWKVHVQPSTLVVW